MAHLSLWLTVCGIVLLCVAVPHASCHPSPVDSRHEIMPYYQQAEQPEQYRHSDDNDVENEDDAANEKINLQEFEPVLKDSTTAARTDEVEGARRMSMGSSENKVLNGYILLLKVLAVFYIAWVMVFPALRDTNAFGISDLLNTLGSSTEPLPEINDILDKNRTLLTSAELKFDEKNTQDDKVVKPLRRFDDISTHTKKSKNADSGDEHVDVFKGLSLILETVSNFTNSLTRTQRDTNVGLLSRMLRLDPVDIALNFLRIEDQPNSKCRERLVCEARYMASTIPFVDDCLSHATSREDFNRAFKYEEAAFVGAQKKDCSIFSCPQTTVQLWTGGL